ncbi:hypothetical protein [Pandoraea norimbergensis]
MLDKSFFVSPEVVGKDVQLKDGSTHKLHFRRVSSYDYQRFLNCLRSPSIDDRGMAYHVLVAASLCDEDGKPALSLEKAKELEEGVLERLFAAALDLNKRVEDEPGNA